MITLEKAKETAGVVSETEATLKIRFSKQKRRKVMRLIILIILVIGLLLTWPYSSGWGYYPSGGLGTLLLILIILWLLGVI